MNEPWQIQLLGGLCLSQGERAITRFRTQKTAVLLAYLAYHPLRSHPREQLIELLWPETEETAARHSLSQALSSLRHQLEPPGVPTGAVLVADRFGVELNPEAVRTDVAGFTEGLRTAIRAREEAERLPSLEQAVACYRGPLLPSLYEDWILTEREHLARRFLEALLQLSARWERAGEPDRALEFARRAVAADPLGEEAHRVVIRLLAAAGHPDAALQLYRELEVLLEQELGATPSAATRTLLPEIERTQAEGRGAGAPVPTLPRGPARAPPTRPFAAEAPLPTGTVTFLLTDIEGSTALWEQLGNEFQAMLTVHHALLRREFHRHGGREVKEGGDSFLVAFAGAADALTCAVGCQRVLAAEPPMAPAGTHAGLRVRVGLHSGDVELRDDGYRGLVLHHAARIGAAAHGGQVLCSEATAGLLRRTLDPGVTLRDLGLFRLRGLEAPERLFQVDCPLLPASEFPPPNADPAHTSRVPLQFTRFFGREGEIAQLVGMLAPEPAEPREAGSRGSGPAVSKRSPPTLHRSRLVTLTGPGGTGKTRLAIEAATELVEAYRGAVWFVPLADLVDPQLIPGAVLDVLGIARSAQAEPMGQVVTALGQQPSLLVLDNLEQLGEGGAEAVRALLERVATLVCLVTSRQVLGLPGEREAPVPPLPTPNGADTPARLGLFESVQLFVDRAQSVKPDFQVTAGNAAAVAELCDRLEGIPLALELAAARALVLTPTQMLAQMTNRFEFLSSRRRGGVARHRTLRAAIDWSYRLLAPELQQFFARLSVFRGGWTAEAAEAVCEEPMALDHLALLRDCSLLLTEEGAESMRFRMLESVREYAGECLAASERAFLGRRHAEYFLVLAEEADRRRGSLPEKSSRVDEGADSRFSSLSEKRRRVDLVRAEQDNLRALLSWSIAGAGEIELGLRAQQALFWFWFDQCAYREARQWIAHLMAHPDCARSSRLYAKALDNAYWFAYCQGDYAPAQELCETALIVFRGLFDRDEICDSLYHLGLLANRRGAYAVARAFWQESLELHRELGLPEAAAEQTLLLAELTQQEGDLATARAVLEDCVAYERKNRGSGGEARFHLGCLSTAEGNYPQARELLEEVLAEQRASGHRRDILRSVLALGDVARGQGSFAEAEIHTREGMRLARELGLRPLVAASLLGAGYLAVAQADLQRAVRLLGAAATLRASMDYWLLPADQARHDTQLNALRAGLPEAEFTALWAVGQNTPWEEAVRFALAETAAGS